MKDFLGKELSVGDYVIFTRPRYRDLTTGKVIKFTPQNIKVIYKIHFSPNTFDEFLISPRDVVKMDAEDTSILILKGNSCPSEL